MLFLQSILKFFRKDDSFFRPSGRSPVPFEVQWETLMRLGFRLNEGITKEDVLNQWQLSEFENNPYYVLYLTLGCTTQRGEQFLPITNQCWFFDAEAIDNEDGDYTAIIHELARLTEGELIFTDVSDNVDFENKVAWVTLTVNGDRYKWDLRVNDDWVDGKLFTEIVALTHKYNTRRKFTSLIDGQSTAIGYQTPEEMEALRQATGLNIEWLRGWSD